MDFYIPNRKPDEKILLLIRRHPFILVLHTHFWFIIMLIPIILSVLFHDAIYSLLKSPIFYPLIIICVSSLYLFIWLLLFNLFIDYYLDVWIVTNYRILNIEQRQIFSRVTSEHMLDKIQDVTAEMHGVIATFLNYGNVHIQTAAEQQRFVFEQIPDPQGTKQKITALCEWRQKQSRK